MAGIRPECRNYDARPTRFRDVLVIREILVDAVREALGRAGLPEPVDGVDVEPADRPEHGDWTTKVPLRIQKAVGRPSRDNAMDIAGQLESEPPPHLARVEVVGPGFVNLYLTPAWLHDVLRETVAQAD